MPGTTGFCSSVLERDVRAQRWASCGHASTAVTGRSSGGEGPRSGGCWPGAKGAVLEGPGQDPGHRGRAVGFGTWGPPPNPSAPRFPAAWMGRRCEWQFPGGSRTRRHHKRTCPGRERAAGRGAGSFALAPAAPSPRVALLTSGEARRLAAPGGPARPGCPAPGWGLRARSASQAPLCSCGGGRHGRGGRVSPLPSPRTEPAGLARPRARAPEQEPGGASACGVTADTYVEAALPSQRKGFSPCRRTVVLGCRYFSENAGTGLYSCCCTPGAPREPWFLPTWPCVAAPVGALDAAASGPAFPAGTFHLQTGREDWASVGPRRGVGEDKRVVWPGTAGPWTVEVPHWPVRWVWAEGVLSLTVDSADGGGRGPWAWREPCGQVGPLGPSWTLQTGLRTLASLPRGRGGSCVRKPWAHARLPEGLVAGRGLGADRPLCQAPRHGLRTSHSLCSDGRPAGYGGTSNPGRRLGTGVL